MKATGKTVKEILISLPPVLKQPLVMVVWVMLFRIHFILRATIVSQSNHSHSLELLRKKIPLIFTIWVFMPTLNY
jgi:hypothetical protein